MPQVRDELRTTQSTAASDAQRHAEQTQRLQGELAACAPKLEAMQQQIDALMAQRDEVISEKRAVDSQLAVASAEKRNLEELVNKTEAFSTAQLRDQREVNDTLRRRLDAAAEERMALLEQKDAATEGWRQVQEQLAAVAAEKRAADVTILKTEEQLRASSARCGRLETELRKVEACERLENRHTDEMAVLPASSPATTPARALTGACAAAASVSAASVAPGGKAAAGGSAMNGSTVAAANTVSGIGFPQSSCCGLWDRMPREALHAAAREGTLAHDSTTVMVRQALDIEKDVATPGAPPTLEVEHGLAAIRQPSNPSDALCSFDGLVARERGKLASATAAMYEMHQAHIEHTLERQQQHAHEQQLQLREQRRHYDALRQPLPSASLPLSPQPVVQPTPPDPEDQVSKAQPLLDQRGHHQQQHVEASHLSCNASLGDLSSHLEPSRGR